MKKANTYLLVGSGLSALLLTGLTLTAHAATNTTDPSVLAFDQKLSNGQIVLDYALLPEKGYAVVYGADQNGNPIREPLGHVELNAGDHRQVKIKLNSEPPKGSKLWVSLYSDKDGKPGFDRQRDGSLWGDKLPKENQIIVQ